jgi:uncharacterized protein with HEPN domain
MRKFEPADILILERVNEWIDFAENYIKDMTFETFSKDHKTQHAVGFCLIQIGSELNGSIPGSTN